MKILLSAIFLFSNLLLIQAQGEKDSTSTSESKETEITRSTSTTSTNVESPDKPSEKKVDKDFGVIFNGASVGFSAGMNFYHGDLADYGFFPKFSDFDTHVTPGFKFTLARDIIWGFNAQLNFQKGSLKGTRKTGKNSSVITFQSKYYDLSLQIRYLLSDALFKKNSRFKLYTNLGLGYMWYRTQLYDTETLGTKDFEGYIETENTQQLSQKNLSDKTPAATSLTIPYGITLIYRANHKIDIHLDITQSSTTTDRLDAFSRNWTALDKYNYIGLGFTYNFNRTLEDAPKKRIKKSKKKNDSTASTTTKKKKGLFGKKKKKVKEDELLNVRLKLFETQLKLFEMQYLLSE